MQKSVRDGGNKNDGGKRSNIDQHTTMFKSVAELLSWKDSEDSAPAHPSLFTTWKEGADEVIEEVLRSGEVEMSTKEAGTFENIKEIGYSILEKFLREGRAVGWASQSPETRREAIETLLTRPHIPQRTVEWYAQGKQVLTASEFATLFKSPRAVSQLVLAKAAGLAVAEGQTAPTAAALTNRLACLTCEMGPFDWGIRFEPVVKQVLAKEGGVVIAESGRVMHPSDPFLAASPDGLILDAVDKRRIGRLIEIKCPISRSVGEGIPFEYWCQMQVQMEVTGIEECEYVEMKIDSIRGGDRELAEGRAPEGYVWLLQNAETVQMTYVYEAEKKVELEGEGWELIETIPWRVEKVYKDVVVRDRAWFKRTAPAREAFWADVEKARRGEYQAVEARVRAGAPNSTTRSKTGGPLKVNVIKEPAACLILDDEDPPESALGAGAPGVGAPQATLLPPFEEPVQQ